MTPARVNFDPSAGSRAISLGRRTLVLVMFVLAASPVVTLARGLELAVLIHATSREGHRRAPAIERLHAAAVARAAVDAAARAPDAHDRPLPAGADPACVAASADRCVPVQHHVRTALLSLPPPPVA